MPRLDAELLIAIKTGWSRTEIRAIPVHELSHILERLTKTTND